MADDLAQLGDGLAELLNKARMLERAHHDAIAVNRPVHDAILAIERLSIAANFIRSLYEQPLASSPVSEENQPVYAETSEPLPHQRKPMNPALSEALRRDDR